MSGSASKKTSSYVEAGVDIEAGDEASRILYVASRATWKNRACMAADVNFGFDFFSSVRYVDTSRFSGMVMGMNFDGVGTKIEIAERMGDHTTIAYDLLAMVCDDAARDGGEPVLVGSILDFKEIDLDVVRQLAQGLQSAADAAGVAVVNGEVAELGDRVGGYSRAAYNWGAAVIWLGRKERLLSGNDITPGDAIVALEEKGFRSNGLTLVRRVLVEGYGPHWHSTAFEDSTLGAAVLSPSTIYSRLVVALTGGCEGNPRASIHGIAHVTGGGVPGKLQRLLRASQRGACLEDLFPPSSIMLHCQTIANVLPAEAYRTWNMGNGLLVVTPEPARVLEVAMEMGFSAKVAGEVTEAAGIRLRTQGRDSGNWLQFDR